MTFNQVHNMDEITHARAVRRIVVRPKYGEGGSLADSHLGDEWHQIVRHTGRAFANKAAVVSANGVEVAQHNCREVGLRTAKVLKDVLDDQLGLPIRIGGGALCGLGDGLGFRVAIYSGG